MSDREESKVDGRMSKKSKSRKFTSPENVKTRRYRMARKIVASSRIALRLIVYRSYYELLPLIEHGSILCIQILIARETCIIPT